MVATIQSGLARRAVTLADDLSSRATSSRLLLPQINEGAVLNRDVPLVETVVVLRFGLVLGVCEIDETSRLCDGEHLANRLERVA